eukprot:TRINITY_DN7109_c0_g1_i1.p1 TRINITY_DN7109_c0_g1~~TRINITY_DN7109_c0_g1_i1.p1  ORF type:complete len:532 (+),score=132.53 TRINITY_DN7109_c0_g1_i1:125-1597(+)
MEEEQVQRVGTALNKSANAIQGINTKFDEIDKKWERIQKFNGSMNAKVEGTIDALEKMDKMLTNRVNAMSVGMVFMAEELTNVIESLIKSSDHFDLNRHVKQLPAAFIPVALPMIVLLVELAVANAYMGILLASVADIRTRYSRYLLMNAITILIGLSLSLLWLIFYRIWAWKNARNAKKKSALESKNEIDEIEKFRLDMQAKLQRMRDRVTVANMDRVPSKVSAGSLREGQNENRMEKSSSDEEAALEEASNATSPVKLTKAASFPAVIPKSSERKEHRNTDLTSMELLELSAGKQRALDALERVGDMASEAAAAAPVAILAPEAASSSGTSVAESARSPIRQQVALPPRALSRLQQAPEVAQPPRPLPEVTQPPQPLQPQQQEQPQQQRSDAQADLSPASGSASRSSAASAPGSPKRTLNLMGFSFFDFTAHFHWRPRRRTQRQLPQELPQQMPAELLQVPQQQPQQQPPQQLLSPQLLSPRVERQAL